jgi:hypothetical protein
MTDLHRNPLPSGDDRRFRDDPDRPSEAGRSLPARPAGRDDAEALVEQAKGVVMFCRGIGADDAGRVLVEWSVEWDVPTATVARILVQDICQGVTSISSDKTHRDLIRWLENRLRQ